MHYRKLGTTGLYVSEICLGTMTFGGKGFWEAIGKLGTSEAESLVGTALDAGVNFIDTADVYSEARGARLVAVGRRAVLFPVAGGAQRGAGEARNLDRRRGDLRGAVRGSLPGISGRLATIGGRFPSSVFADGIALLAMQVAHLAMGACRAWADIWRFPA